MTKITFYIFLTVGYWAWSVAFFTLVQKTVFFVANKKLRPKRLTAAVYTRGFVSDAIVASYLTALPIFIGLAAATTGGHWPLWALTAYNVLIALALGLITVGDAALYGFWHSKIDASVFAYLRHPKGAFASVSGGYLAVGFTAAAVVAAIWLAGAQSVASKSCAMIADAEVGGPWWTVVATVGLFLLFAAAAVVIIRGLKIRPNNPSVVYFSPEPFLNHWALNPCYNMIYSLGTRNEYEGRFVAFDDEECDRIAAPLFPTSGTPTMKLLNQQKPNILIVVWESFGSEFCGAIGGRKDVTPRFDRLCDEGVLFAECRASSFRTDRALPAIFCGLPGQPATSIVRHTRKLPSLPAWPRDLRDKLGYTTVAIHGGDLSIMHKSDFYLSSGHNTLIAQKDFPAGLDKGKWGVHDAPAMDVTFDEIMGLEAEGKRPWLVTLQTLSSHEPFVVPYARLADEADNSMAYTDEALGHLVDKLKESGAWADMLLIVVADHGLNRPESMTDRKRNSHIPLLLAGGAVARPMRLDTMMCQTDLAATLLGQLGLDHKDYPFSRDVLADTYTVPSTMHSYINGFLFTDATGSTDYDNVRQTPAPGTEDPDRERRGKAIQQKVHSYIAQL